YSRAATEPTCHPRRRPERSTSTPREQAMNGDVSLARWDLLQRRSLIVGFIGLLFCGGGGLIFSQPFFLAYFSAYVFWIFISGGCLALLILYLLFVGRWGFLFWSVVWAGVGAL